MKKLIAIAVVLALVAGVAFAQVANGIQVQAWGRGSFSPISAFGPTENGAGEVNKDADGDDDSDSFAGSSTTWGNLQGWSNAKGRVDFRINGASDYVGFNTQFSAENGIGVEDNMHIWLKPFSNDILKVAVGKVNDDTLRGKVGNLDDGFSNFVLNNTPEEDPIFSRFGVNNGVGDYGFTITSAPVDGLFIGLQVKGALGGGDLTRTATAYRYMQIGAGYNIANIGHIRAQYIGGWSGEIDPENKDYKKSVAAGDDYYSVEDWALDDDGNLQSWATPGNGITIKSGRIEAAFALTAVEGLLVDLGTKIWLPLSFKGSDAKYTKGLDLSLGAKFNSGAFGIGARVDISGLGAGFKADNDDKSEDAAKTVIRLVPTFGVGDATIGLDIAFALKGESKASNGDAGKDSTSQIGFGAFVKKGVGPGHIMAGLSYTLPEMQTAGDNNGKAVKGSAGVFQIPIILEYYFF